MSNALLALIALAKKFNLQWSKKFKITFPQQISVGGRQNYGKIQKNYYLFEFQNKIKRNLNENTTEQLPLCPLDLTLFSLWIFLSEHNKLFSYWAFIEEQLYPLS